MEKLLTVDEFCELTGVTKRTVYQAHYQKRYPFQVISGGRKLRFRKADVEKWIDDGCPYLPARAVGQ